MICRMWRVLHLYSVLFLSIFSMTSSTLRVGLQRKYSNPSDYDAFLVVRLNNSSVAKLGGRNSWVCIRSECGKSVFRMIRGAGSTITLPVGALEFDYETSIALGVPKGVPNPQGFYPCALSVRRATYFEILLAHWQHPDPAYRFPLQISLISLFLGVIGLCLGIVSMK